MIQWPNMGIWGQFGPCENGTREKVNQNFFLIDVFLNASFKDFIADASELPEEPDNGDVYITLDDKKIHIFKIDDWVVVHPEFGMIVGVQSNNLIYYFDGTNWVSFASNSVNRINNSSSVSPVLLDTANPIPFSGTHLENIVFIAGNGSAKILTANPVIQAGSFIGQKLRVVGQSTPNTIQIDDNLGVKTNGVKVLIEDSIVDYVYNGVKWIETGVNAI